MQLTPLCLFTILCGYSLVIAAPVNQNKTDSLETKQQKATAIASRLLQELANEQSGSFHPASKSNENDNNVHQAVHQPKPSQNELNVEKTHAFETDDDEEDEAAFLPVFDDFYPVDADRYVDDESSSLENIDEDELEQFLLPIREQQLINYLSQQQQQDNTEEDLTPVVHSPVMDDSVMTAEDHHEQRRRRRSIY